MLTTMSAYDELVSRCKECSLIGSVTGLLHWDMQTMMPPKGGARRGEQLALLSGLAHSRLVDPRVGELIEFLGARVGELDEDQQANVREIGRDYQRATRIPQELVEEISRHQSHCHEVWVKARSTGDFDMFAPDLEKMVQLMAREAECLGYPQTPLDALIDLYEPDATTAMFTAFFEEIKAGIIPLLDKVTAAPVKVDRSFLRREFPESAQQKFGEAIVRQVGFDMEGGRIDTTVHPFCAGTLGDVRLTCRYDEHAPEKALFGIIHEMGHGLYEQGFSERDLGTPLSEALSYGIHESQSRLWENFIGRGLPFWTHFFPRLQKTFPQATAGVSLEQFVLAVNHVERSLVRVEADQLTYDLHIIVRFEIERDLFAGAISVSDLPRAWNRKMESYLGLTPPNNGTDGVLQDVHWSGGMFGYFPSYSLGNVAAAQLWYALRRDVPTMDQQVQSGEFKEVLAWLRDRVHQHGRRYSRDELMQRATGKPLGTADYVRYLTDKFSALYKL